MLGHVSALTSHFIIPSINGGTVTAESSSLKYCCFCFVYGLAGLLVYFVILSVTKKDSKRSKTEVVK